MVAMSSLAKLLVSKAGRFGPRVHYLDRVTSTSQSNPHFDARNETQKPNIDGLDVVDKIEVVGSQSGKTAKSVVVKECGEILD
jgi:hypothetical protein